MPATTKHTKIQLWHYMCPECGFGDREMGYQGLTHMIYCEVCIEEERHVKLKRWPVDHDSGTLPGDRLG